MVKLNMKQEASVLKTIGFLEGPLISIKVADKTNPKGINPIKFTTISIK